MKKLFILIFYIFIFMFLSGCRSANAVSEESCKEEGKLFKEAMMLNYRTGEMELRGLCYKREK